MVTRCVAFDAPSLTGEQVMSMSGIEYATATYGSLGRAVCQVDGEPATYPPSCWTSSSPYWAMFVARGGGGWAVSARGVSSQTFADGDALGWHYVPQSGPGGGPPPSQAGVCGVAAAPPPAAALTPAAGPEPAATAVPAAPTGDGPVPASETPGAAASASAGPTGGAEASGARLAPASAARTASTSPPGVETGWLVASAGVGALGGLLLLQLIGPRIRR